MGIIKTQSIKNSLSLYIGVVIGAINTILVFPFVFEENPELLLVVALVVDYNLKISSKSSGGSLSSKSINSAQSSGTKQFVGSGIKVGDTPIEAIMSACRRGMISACF